MHGEMPQKERDAIMAEFRSGSSYVPLVILAGLVFILALQEVTHHYRRVGSWN